MMIRIWCVAALFLAITTANLPAQTVVINDTGNWQGVARMDPAWRSQQSSWSQTGANLKEKTNLWSWDFPFKIINVGWNTIRATVGMPIGTPDLEATQRVLTTTEVQPPIVRVPANGANEERLEGWKLAVSYRFRRENEPVQYTLDTQWSASFAGGAKNTDTIKHSTTDEHSVSIGGEWTVKSLTLKGAYGYKHSDTVETAAISEVSVNYEDTFAVIIGATPGPVVGSPGEIVRLEWLRTAGVQRVHINAYPDENEDGLADGPLTPYTLTAYTTPGVEYRAVKVIEEVQP